MKDINIGLIGYKFMGKAHSNAFSMLPMFFDTKDRIVKKVLCGTNEEALAKAVVKLGFLEYQTSYYDLVKRDDIDVIDITTPSFLHKEPALLAAHNKKHIFCEKPLALNYKDAKEMYQEAEKAQVKHQVGFNYRFAPALALAKKMIEQGKLGKIYHFRGAFLQDWVMDPDFPKSWRLDKKAAGSGALGDLGAHVIDLARYLVGDIDSITGMWETFITKRPSAQDMEGLSAMTKKENIELEEVDVDDAAIFMFRFKNGSLGTIETTRFAGGHKNNMNFEINGEKGSLKFEFENMNELLYFNKEDPQEYQGFRRIKATDPLHPYVSAWWPPGHIIGYENTFVHQFYEFFQSISLDKPTNPSFYDGMMASKVLDAVELSIKENTWIKVDDVE